MKQFYSGMLVMLALALALVLGVVALAESVEGEATQPAVTEEAPAAETPAAEASSEDAAALQEALDAYNSARQSSRTESLEVELDGYVASGKMTREQADLVLKHYKDQEALRNGVCPNCGYQFQNNGGFGRGGRMNGGKGGRTNGGRGGMRGFGQRPSQNQGGGQTNSASGAGLQPMPFASGSEGI